MKIAMQYQSEAFCREAFRQTKLIQDHAEYIVPDILEDLGQIVSAEAQICLKSKEIVDHGVEIGAQADISVFYITEGRDRVRSMRFSKSIETLIECPSPDPTSEIQLLLICQGVQARAVNPRKIAVQIALWADLSCWISDSLELPTELDAEETDGLQLLRRSAESVMTVQLEEKNFVISEQLPLDAQLDPHVIVCSRAELIYTDCQIIGSKALIKGGAQLRIGYETEDGPAPFFKEYCIPFSVLIDMPDENCTIGRILLQPTALYSELSDAINGSRVVELELHAAAQVSIEKTKALSYIADAYSTRCPLSIEERAVPICGKRERNSLRAETTERIRVENERGLVTGASADIISFGFRDGKALLSASVSLLLQAEDGSFSALQRLVSLETDLSEAGEELLAARISDLSAERQGEDILIKLTCDIDCYSEKNTEVSSVFALDLDAENSYDPASVPSVTVAKRDGRELWEIAKAYRSNAEAIGAMSEKHVMPGDLLLIPRV